MNEKRALVLGITVLAVLVVGLILNFGCADTGSGTVRIGAILPLTGTASEFGNWMRQGLELATEDLTARKVLGDRKLVLDIEDSKGDPKTGLSAFNKLNDVDKVDFVFSAISGVTLAVLPLSTDAGVLVLTSSTHPDITSGKYLALRIYMTPDQEAVGMADFAFTELKARKAGVIYLNDQSLRGYEQEFRKRFESLGGIVSSESYDPGSSDFRAQLTKLKAFQPEVLYVGGWREIGQILRQAVELDLKVQIIGPVTFDSPKTVEIAGAAAEGAIFTVPAYEAGSPSQKDVEFRKKYEQRYAKQPDVNVAIYYDFLSWLGETIAAAGDNPVAVKDSMKRTSYEGVLGSLRFKENGDIVMPIQYMTIQGGKFVPYKQD